MWLVTLAWQRSITAALRPFDLTHIQFVLLASAWWLDREGAAPTQRVLSEHAGTDQMMTSQVLRRLEDKGLVRREADTVDTRAKLVYPTPAGEACLMQALPCVEEADARFFAPVSRTQLLDVLGRLAAGNREALR